MRDACQRGDEMGTRLRQSKAARRESMTVEEEAGKYEGIGKIVGG